MEADAVAADPSPAWRRRLDGWKNGKLGRWVDAVDRDRQAHRAGWVIWAVGIAVLVWAGRDQWFVRDDWAFLFSRDRFRQIGGIDSMLLVPQDGHWMTWPVLTFAVMRSVFGVGSYLPYLVVLWATHVAAVLLARMWLRRLGVSAWNTVLLTGVLLVFGAGWENLVFAVQIVYNFSLIAFLAHTLLVDHDGPVDRRDWAGAGISLIGVSSSGFGPFFAFGVGLLLALRRRWTAAAIAVVPQAIAWSWWWLTWGADPAGAPGNAGPRFVERFVRIGMEATAGSLMGTAMLAWPALLLCAAIVLWSRTGAARRAPIIAFLATATAMFAGIGLRREVFGLAAAGWPRYQYMAAFLIVPALGVGLDQARRFAPWARWVPRLILAFAIARNARWLDHGAQYWGSVSAADRQVFELVAGSGLTGTVPADGYMTEVSPDVQIRDLPELVEDGAITPRSPASPEEQAILDAAIERAGRTGLLPVGG